VGQRDAGSAVAECVRKDLYYTRRGTVPQRTCELSCEKTAEVMPLECAVSNRRRHCPVPT
jgi:hypothetical protein